MYVWTFVLQDLWYDGIILAKQHAVLWTGDGIKDTAEFRSPIWLWGLPGSVPDSSAT